DSGNMSRTARPGVPQGSLVGVCLQPRDQFLQVVRRNGVLCQKDLRGIRHERNRIKIVDHIVGECIDSRIHHMYVERKSEAMVVAVGLGAGYATSTKGSIRAGNIFNDKGLAERVPHTLSDDAHDRIRRTARAGWNDDGDWTRRISLRTCR